MSQYIAYARTADAEDDFFDTYIFAGTGFDAASGDIVFPEPLTIRGNNYTSLLVTNGYSLMDSFP